MALPADWAGRQADPCSFVIFGASGDLTSRLLMPALYRLALHRRLTDSFAIIGLAHSQRTNEDFRRGLREGLKLHTGEPLSEKTVGWLLDRTIYVQGEFEDPGAYDRLAEALAKTESERGIPANRVYYLATPPAAFVPIVQRLGQKGLAAEKEGWRRVVIEKPFGTDLASAQALNRQLLSVFAESQIYRIDHYLGKETVQNVMALRFANGIFESLWYRDRIDHVQITAAETVTVEGRGKFYDATGALRDMIPNHLFQLLSLITMEPPTSFTADDVRAEKAKVLRALHPFTSETAMRDVMRGQYGAGTVAGRSVPAYRQSPDVPRDSTTETYVALRLMIDNWRWAGVPFFLRTGKALAARRTEVAIKFKEAPFAIFRETPVDTLGENFIVLRIQPDEGIAMQFNAKVPGLELTLGGVRMDFKYQDYFAAEPTNGYETLLYDCMIGDATLFQQAEEIEAGWRLLQPILDDWREAPARDLMVYPAGSEGPAAADDLLARDGRHWRRIEVGGNRPESPAVKRAQAERGERLVLPDEVSAARAIAEWLLERALATEGEPVMCLAGGSTPHLAYRMLAEPELCDQFPWLRVHWVFGDERMVPRDSERSNYRMVREALFDRVPIPAGKIHPVPTELGDPARTAEAYEATLTQIYGSDRLDPKRPLFAATLLGIGEDGHTASLFPGTAVLQEQRRWVAAVTGYAPEPRVTLTRPALQSSAELTFLATGAAKRDIIARIWQGENLPAASIRPVGRLRWVLDHAAAAALGT